MKKPCNLSLPWPPSVNHYWISRCGKSKTGKPIVLKCVGKRGKEFREEVDSIVRSLGAEPLTGRLILDIALYPPTKRKFDIDNYLKATLDALQHAGLFEDDEQIDCITVKKYVDQVVPGGQVLMIVREKHEQENI